MINKLEDWKQYYRGIQSSDCIQVWFNLNKFSGNGEGELEPFRYPPPPRSLSTHSIYGTFTTVKDSQIMCNFKKKSSTWILPHLIPIQDLPHGDPPTPKALKKGSWWLFRIWSRCDYMLLIRLTWNGWTLKYHLNTRIYFHIAVGDSKQEARVIYQSWAPKVIVTYQKSTIQTFSMFQDKYNEHIINAFL